MYKEIRNPVVNYVNNNAREAYKSYNEARKQCYALKYQKIYILEIASKLNITEKESCTELMCIREENRDLNDDQNTELINTALEYIEAEYKKDKYDGREAVSFFSAMFKNMNHKISMQFEDNV
jgi:hypothetical protein